MNPVRGELPADQQDCLARRLLAVTAMAEEQQWSRRRLDEAVAHWSRALAAPTDVLTVVAAARRLDQPASPRRTELLDQALHAGVAAVAERLVQEALTDSLTGLATRARLEEEVQRLVAVAARTRSPLAVVMVDIDGLKRINDEHGHHAGDEAIAEVGRAIREHTRSGDRAFRFGGDEFVVFMPGTTAEQARAVVERVQRSCRTATSAGVALHSGAASDTDLAGWLRRADTEMYARRHAARAARAAATGDRRRTQASARPAHAHPRRPRPGLAGAVLVLLASTVASGMSWLGASQVARVPGSADPAPLTSPVPRPGSPAPAPRATLAPTPPAGPVAVPTPVPAASATSLPVEQQIVEVPVDRPQVPLLLPTGMPASLPPGLPVPLPTEPPVPTPRPAGAAHDLLDGPA